MKFRLSVVSVALVCASSTVAFAGDDWKKAFAEKFASKNSWERASAVKALDPNNADQMKQLFKIAKGEDQVADWFIRFTCAEVLAGKLEAKALDACKAELKKGTGNVAEVIATAFGKSKDTDRVEDLILGLQKAGDWKVKRACAIALGDIPAKKGVSALIEALEKEAKNFLVFVHIMEALERATGEKDKKTAADWKGWWSGAEPNWEPGQKKEGEGDDNKSGERIRTVVRGTDLDFRSRGKGRPLLVLPEYGYEKDYFETYLRNLEDTNQILYMKLPGTADFKPALPNRQGTDQPDYPLDKLVEVFEELRTTLIKDKKLEDKPYAILGHGISAWIGMQYAIKNPKGCSRLIVCSGYASGRAFSRNLTAMEADGKKTGDQELEHYAQSLQYVNGQPKYRSAQGDEFDAVNHRKAWTTMFSDWKDLEIGRMFGPWVEKPIRMPAVERYMGGCWVPDFDVAKTGPIPVPTLIVGGDAYFGNAQDAEEIAKSCQKPTVQIMKGRMPFYEDNAKFVKTVEKFLH